MENTFQPFGTEDFKDEFANFGFGESEEVTADSFTAPTPVEAPTSSRSRIDDFHFSQINGMQNTHYRDLESAKEAILAMDAAEIQRRKENGEAFQWVKTIIDKANWDTKEDGTRYVKSPKFLGWLVITADSAGIARPVTNAELLSYITAHCPDTGRIGSGTTGLQLRHALRKNKSSKGSNFAKSIVFSLVPLDRNISKYAPEKIEEAKEPVFEEDGVTPVMALRPGKEADSKIPTDYTQVYRFKKEYEMFIPAKRGGKKKDNQSAETFKILAVIQGLKPQA